MKIKELLPKQVDFFLKLVQESKNDLKNVKKKKK